MAVQTLQNKHSIDPTICRQNFNKITKIFGLVKDLGIYLSDDLSWTPHINIMVNNARKMASCVLGVFKVRTKDVMLQLYKSMIRCRVEYCCPVWNPLNVQDIQNIEDIQRHFTRKIHGCKEIDYWERLKLLNLQSLQRRRERYLIIIINYY